MAQRVSRRTTRAAEPARLAYAVIGLAMGFGVEQLMNSMLFNAGGVNVLAYIVVVPSLFLVTMLAAYVPAATSIPDCANASVALRVGHGPLWAHNEG